MPLDITLPDVPPIIPSARYDDDIVQQLQLDFDSKLPWLDRAYHIARVGIISKDELSYPQIQANNDSNEHFDIRPDNQIGAYCFFEVESPYIPDFNDREVEYFLSVVFWGNLKIIDGATTTDFTSQLIQDVVKRLSRFDAAGVSVEERPELIFDKYSGLTQEKNQFLLRKYTAFKITFSIKSDLTNDC